MATDALSGNAALPSCVTNSYFHMASLSIVLLLMLSALAVRAMRRQRHPSRRRGGEHRAGGYPSFSRLLSASDVCAHDRAGDGPGPERHYQYNS